MDSIRIQYGESLFSLIIVNSSRPERLKDIADRFNVDHEAVLDNVLYARAYTSKNFPIFLKVELFYLKF